VNLFDLADQLFAGQFGVKRLGRKILDVVNPLGQLGFGRACFLRHDSIPPEWVADEFRVLVGGIVLRRHLREQLGVLGLADALQELDGLPPLRLRHSGPLTVDGRVPVWPRRRIVVSQEHGSTLVTHCNWKLAMRSCR
jgi:hypothetical protein